MPLEDIRGVIIATEGVTLTNTLVCELLEQGAFILHCDKKYQPVGLTEPLPQTINRDLSRSQACCEPKLRTMIWKKLLHGKLINQIAVLRIMKAPYSYLEKYLEQEKINESACARYYWRRYFNQIGYKQLTRRHDNDHPTNQMLNYAYAVLGAICHRSIVGHGMSPLFGVHHSANFHGHPFVYDVIEPLRPVVDYHLYMFHESTDYEKTPENWVKHARQCWDYKITHAQGTLRLVDAVDLFVQSIAKAFIHRDGEKIWIPQVA